MKRFKNILFLLDYDHHDSDIASDIAVNLARLNDAQITIALTKEASFLENLSVNVNPWHQEVLDYLRTEQDEHLDGILRQERWSELSVSRHNGVMDGFVPIIQKVIRDKHDLVLIEETAEEGLTPLSMRLVRKCPCPVWVVKEGKNDFRRVLGAVDVGSDEPETVLLNEKIIELTYSLAQRERGESHYLNVWNLPYEGMLSSPRIKISHDEITKMKDRVVDTRKRRLDELLNKKKISYSREQFHIVEGKFVETMSTCISDMNIDVVVMGSVARTGIPGLLMGNRAEELLQKIRCSVLTVKPDDFVSPVTV